MVLFFEILIFTLINLLSIDAYSEPEKGQLRKELFFENSTSPLFVLAWTTNPNVNIQTPYGPAQFMNYWDENMEKQALIALQSGVDINERDSKGRTALMHAIAAPNSGLFSFLLKMGARVDVKDIQGNNIEDIRRMVNNTIALFYGLNILIQHAYQGVDISSIIFDAVNKSDTKTLEEWFKRGVSVNYSHQWGISILNRAIDKKDEKMIQFLVDKGAKININDVITAIEIKDFKNAKYLANKIESLDVTSSGIIYIDGNKNHIEINPILLAAEKVYTASGVEGSKDFLAYVLERVTNSIIVENTIQYANYQRRSFVIRSDEEARILDSTELIKRTLTINSCKALFN